MFATPKSVERMSTNEDLTWMSRMLAATSRGYRLVYGIALAILITLYVFLAVPTDYEVTPLFHLTQPLLLIALIAGWCAVGQPIWGTRLGLVLLLSLFALFFIVGAMRIFESRDVIREFSKRFPDPRWHEMLTQIGPDGPFIFIAGIVIVINLILITALLSVLVLRVFRVGRTGKTLAGLEADVRRQVSLSGDAPSMIRLIDASRWKGWIAGAAAIAVLLSTTLLSGRERAIPGAEGLVGLLPDAIARVVTFLNDRAWALLIAIIIATMLWQLARRYLMPEASFALNADQRPPILLLRSYKDDHVAVAPVGLWRRLLHPVLWPLWVFLNGVGLSDLANLVRAITRRRIEEVAAQSLRDAGPFIAVSARGERVPQLGAFRTTLCDDEWQEHVRRWLGDARLIVMIAGTTPSVCWELETAAELGVLGKLILLIPPGTRCETQERWQFAMECLKGTDWYAEMVKTDFRCVVAVVFKSDGRVFTMTGLNSTQHSYDLAVRIGTGMVVARSCKSSSEQVG